MKLLENENYFEQLLMPTVIKSFDQTKIKLDPESAKYINNLLVQEYVYEYKGIIAA